MQLAEAIQERYKADERERFEDDETGLLLADWEVGQRTAGYEDSKLSSYAKRNVQPDPNWLIKGFIPQVGFGQIYGASGSGKTYFALDLALSVANYYHFLNNGVVPEWMGHKIKRGGDVIYAVMEGSFTFQNRVQAWVQGHPHSHDSHLFTWDEHSLNLADNGESAEAFADSILRADLWGGPLYPKLIVFDTQRMSFEGAEDEINYKAIAESVKQLSNGFGCAVVLVHHTGYDDTHARGSTVLKDALSFQFFLKPNKSHGEEDVSGTAYVEKNKYGRTPGRSAPWAAYKVEYLDIVKYNQDKEDWGDSVLLDEDGEPVRDGYCKQGDTTEVIRAALSDYKALEALDTAGDAGLTHTDIRKALGGAGGTMKARADDFIERHSLVLGSDKHYHRPEDTD